MNILEIILLFFGGLVAGSYGSIVGGGSLVSFPLLILLGLPTETAIGTNRFNAIFSEASSSFAYWRKNLLQWKYALPLGVLSIPASILGAQIVSGVSDNTINIIIAAALLLLLIFLPKINQMKPTKASSGQIVSYTSKKYLGMSVIVLSLAVYGGFYGAGFGTFILFPFILIGGSSFLQGSANARFVGLLMSIAASVVFISNGQVDYAAAMPQLIGGIIGAQLGVKFAVKAESKWIKLVLTLVVIASAVKLLLDVFS